MRVKGKKQERKKERKIAPNIFQKKKVFFSFYMVVFSSFQQSKIARSFKESKYNKELLY